MIQTLATYRSQTSKSLFLFGLQVLCKMSFDGTPTVGFSTVSVYASIVCVAKNPLRVIVARFPFFEDFYHDGGQHLAYFLDTLICGHQQVAFFLDVFAGKKRHRCGECAQAKVLALPPKKPASSAPAIERKKAA